VIDNHFSEVFYMFSDSVIGNAYKYEKEGFTKNFKLL